MEDESQDEKALTSFLPKPSRCRNPTFLRMETESLVNIIEKFKHIVQSKSTSNASSQAKDAAWVQIAKLFNKQGFEFKRTPDALKTKWENLKKEARRISKNDIDSNPGDSNPLYTHVLSVMLSEADSSVSVDVTLGWDKESDNDENVLESQKESANGSERFMDESEDVQSDENSCGADGDIENRRMRKSRTSNFTPQECSLLLQCVKQEKKDVFCKEVSGKALELKHRAWLRVTDSYNRLSPEKRTTKVLRTKFSNMKRMARLVGFKGYLKGLSDKHEKLDISVEEIKKEPAFENKTDLDSDVNDDDVSSNRSNHNYTFPPDPLSSVLNSDSGIGTNGTESSNQDNKKVVKLKLELLNYQMENAKLERKKLEDALNEEAVARESRALETALRLRAARLDALAAEMKFPPAHPGLRFTPQEARAQQYLSNYQPT